MINNPFYKSWEQYLSELTPQERAFVQQYDTGPITPEERAFWVSHSRYHHAYLPLEQQQGELADRIRAATLRAATHLKADPGSVYLYDLFPNASYVFPMDLTTIHSGYAKSLSDDALEYAMAHELKHRQILKGQWHQYPPERLYITLARAQQALKHQAPPYEVLPSPFQTKNKLFTLSEQILREHFSPKPNHPKQPEEKTVHRQVIAAYLKKGTDAWPAFRLEEAFVEAMLRANHFISEQERADYEAITRAYFKKLSARQPLSDRWMSLIAPERELASPRGIQ